MKASMANGRASTITTNHFDNNNKYIQNFQIDNKDNDENNNNLANAKLNNPTLHKICIYSQSVCVCSYSRIYGNVDGDLARLEQ